MTPRLLIKQYKLPAVAAVGVLFAAITVFSRPAESGRTPPMQPPASPYAASVAGIGVVEPRSEIISIGVELPGVVRELKVKVGDTVKAGDELFLLDHRDIDAQIAALRAAVEAARIAAEDARAQFDLINSVSDKRAIARDDFNRRKFAAELAAARHQQAQAELEKAETTRERQIIRAPIDGQVLEVNLRPGEYASAGSLPSPLMRLGDTSRLHVRVEIDEENAARVKPGSTARGLRRGDTQNPVALHFVRFEPYVRPKQNLAVSGQRVDTRVLQVIYALEDAPGQNVFVGQQMDVFIEDAQTAAKE